MLWCLYGFLPGDLTYFSAFNLTSGQIFSSTAVAPTLLWAASFAPSGFRPWLYVAAPLVLVPNPLSLSFSFLILGLGYLAARIKSRKSWIATAQIVIMAALLL